MAAAQKIAEAGSLSASSVNRMVIRRITPKTYLAVVAIALSVAILSGVGAAQNDSATYLLEVESRIRASWHPPSGTVGLMVTLSYHLGPDGKATLGRIARSSGNSEFDNSALLALDVAGPLPPAPASFHHGRYNIVLHAAQSQSAVSLEIQVFGFLFAIGFSAFLLSALSGYQDLGLFAPPIVGGLLCVILWYNPDADRQSIAMMYIAVVVLVIPVCFAFSLIGSLLGIWVRSGSMQGWLETLLTRWINWK